MAPDSFNKDTETSTFNANDSNMHTQARDPNPMYTQNKNPQPMDAENDVNPNPMYLQSSAGPTFKSNMSADSPCTQTSADTHQQAFSMPATNNDDNHCLQRCQPDAFTHHEHDIAVQYEEDETFGESANNDGNPCIQPYAVTHQEDQEPSNNCDGGQPYAVRYQEDDDSGSAASKNRHTASIASEDEVIQPYAAAYMCQGDLERNTTSEDLSSQYQNQPAAASNNDVLHALDPNPAYAAADTCQGDVERNTASEDTQGSLSSQNLPAAASNSINDANDVLHALNPNLMYVPNVQHPAAHGCTRCRVIFAAAVILGFFIVGGVFLWLARPPQASPKNSKQMLHTHKP
ncbi:hypothetical protein Bbelb_271460 [Branchiostoma belcheri]|nr:hypothetical protein Bbelb_271460 [Branchiostoma belcheri]